jgi:pimeloyl-ACP methyl ester carboxylesterase
MRHPDDALTASLGVRLIAPDRPGYGLSDGQPRRRLIDYPDDIAQLADQLGLDRFSLFGVSAGGPYVAACAHRIPERLLGVAIVSGPAPFDRPQALAGVNRDYRGAYRLAAWPTWALWPTIALHDRAVRSDPGRAFAAVYAQASPDDRAVLADPRITAQIQGYRREASRKGVRGLVREAQILVAPWGFRLSDIRPRIHLWYWDGDSIVPPQMGRFLQAQIPSTVPHFLPGGGHFSIFSHWQPILGEL